LAARKKLLFKFEWIGQMKIRTSIEMLRRGHVVFPFPRKLAEAMKAHIYNFMTVPLAPNQPECDLLKNLTEISNSYTDEEFAQTFAKPFRMFPDSVSRLVIEWVSSLVDQFEGKRTGVNYVCQDEREKNSICSGGIAKFLGEYSPSC